MDKKKRCITTTQASTQTNSTTYNSDEEDKSWELKKRYVQRARQKNQKTFISLSLSLSLSLQGFVTWLYQTFDFLKKLKQLLKLRWNVHSSLPVLRLSRPAMSSQYTHISLSLSLSRYIYWNIFYFLKLFKFQSNPKKKTIYTILYFEYFFQKSWILSHTILHWFYSDMGTKKSRPTTT